MKFTDGEKKLVIEFEEHDTDYQRRMAHNIFFFLCNLMQELQRR